MVEMLDFKEETEPKTHITNQRRYWYFFVPLTLFLILMVKYPLRINIGESLYDVLFYGAISLDCIVTSIHVYRRFGKRGRRLISMILLCSVLSGWQIFDLAILRNDGSAAYSYSPSSFEPLAQGWAWYTLRFPNDDILCHSLSEWTFGNYYISITLEINRDATWFACGG